MVDGAVASGRSASVGGAKPGLQDCGLQGRLLERTPQCAQCATPGAAMREARRRRPTREWVCPRPPQLTWRARRDYKPGATAACAVRNSPGSLEALPKEGGARGPGRFVGRGASAAEAEFVIWSQRREADLSTEQARSQAPARLPRPQRHGRRPQGPQRAPRARPQASFGLIFLRPPQAAAGEHPRDEGA